MGAAIVGVVTHLEDDVARAKFSSEVAVFFEVTLTIRVTPT